MNIITPQMAPCLLAGVAVAVAALAANVGALPNVMVAGGEIDVSTGVPALLESAQMFSGGGGGSGGSGGGGSKIDMASGGGGLLALFVVLIIGGIIVGGIAGGGLGAVGLGAVSGATQGAVTEGHQAARTGVLRSALSGAASGAMAGVLSATISIHLTCAMAGVTGGRWGPFIGVDIVVTVFAVTLLLLCRTSWDNPYGLLGNTIEAVKVVIVLFQYALAFAITLAVLGGAVLAFKWIFN